ncbi:hypothetical protein NN561_015413 [Cricetulus griseus]
MRISSSSRVGRRLLSSGSADLGKAGTQSQRLPAADSIQAAAHCLDNQPPPVLPHSRLGPPALGPVASLRSASSGSASPRPASPCVRAAPPAPPPQHTPGRSTALVCHGPGERREQLLLEKASGRHKEDLRVQGDPRNVSGCWGPEGGSGIGGGSFALVAPAAAAATTTAAEIDWSLRPHCPTVRSCGDPPRVLRVGLRPRVTPLLGGGGERWARREQPTREGDFPFSLATTALHRFSPHA